MNETRTTAPTCRIGEGATCDGILRGALKMLAVGKAKPEEKK